MEIDARMAVTEDKEMDQKGSELRNSGLIDQIANQMTVMMIDKKPCLVNTVQRGKIKKQV